MKAVKLPFLVLILLFVMLWPLPVLAADSDFTVSYEVWPEAVGPKGSDVRITITVTNTGSTNITWLSVAVNTVAGFNELWEDTITPGSHRTRVFSVPFAEADVAANRILQVAMNNNSSANPDGVKMFTFHVDKLEPVMLFNWSVSPSRSTYNVGDTVTITHRYKNESTTHAMTNVRSDITMRADGDTFYGGHAETLDNIFPGDTATTSFRYTFGVEDAGAVQVSCGVSFTLMDRSYSLTRNSLSFEVLAPQPMFNASLSATPTEIDAGDEVELRVTFTNTGEYATDFAVLDNNGFTFSEVPNAPPGWSGIAAIRLPVYESSYMHFTVVGTIGGVSFSLDTNNINITVHPRATEAPSAAASAGESPSALESPPVSGELSAATSPEPSETVMESAGESAMSVQAGGGEGSDILMYVLIGVIAVLFGGVIALIVVLMKRKKPQS